MGRAEAKVTHEEFETSVKPSNNLSAFTSRIPDDKIIQAAALAMATLKSSFKAFKSRQMRSHQVTAIKDGSEMSLIFLFSRKAVALPNLKAVKCLSAEDADAKTPAHTANLLETDDISGSGRGYDGTAEEYSQMQPTDYDYDA